MDFPFMIKKEEPVDYFLISHLEDEPTDATVCDKYSNDLSEVTDNVIKQEPNEYSMNLVHESRPYLAHDESVERERTVKIQRILSDGTVMQSPAASIDASTEITPHASELILDTQLLSKSEASNDQIEQQNVHRENDFLPEEMSNKNAERRRTRDWNEDDYTETENYNKKRLAKTINATIRISEQYVCFAENCVSVFTTRALLNEHKLTHKGQKPYKCNVCNKYFGYKSELNRHSRIHVGEKPYKCSVCDKSFTQLQHVSTHMRIHNGEKPYKCSVCDKSFSQSSTLLTHMRIHNGEKPFKCSACNKSFRRSSDLTRHMKVHSGKKPYKCSECDKSFTESSSLSTHMRIHTGDKPYKCSECDKSFSHSYNNQPNSTKERFSCDYCGKGYFNKRSIELHCLSCYKNRK